ncbi:MAG: SUMF1/EgtB/PvdO family nonheme iron enzyme [Deinococcales bacterium]
MQKIWLKLLGLLMVLNLAMAQVSMGESVDFYGNLISYRVPSYSFTKGLGFEAKYYSEVSSALNRVLVLMDARPNIELAYDEGVYYPMAVFDNEGHAFIIYGVDFIAEVLKGGEEADWVLMTILAHEVGHHARSHIRMLQFASSLSTAEHRTFELEADEFAGYMLCKLGATEAQTQLAYQNYTSDASTSQHPSKESRLINARAGWVRAKEQGICGGNLAGAPPPIQENPVGSDRLNPPQNQPAAPTLNQPAISSARSVPDGRQPITRNADWTPVVGEFDGVRMVLVPVGAYLMGSEDIDMRLCEGGCSKSWYENEKPQHLQEIKEPYWLDQTEVTREAYQRCISAGKCTATPANEYSTDDEHPINQVTWIEAKAYCEWRGSRLPTEVEWEYAARGPDGLRFPWGNDYEVHKVNGRDAGYKIKAVGSYPEGASWVGALDMSGNVWEWVSSQYKAYPYLASDGREQEAGSNVRVMRGGSSRMLLFSSVLRIGSRVGSMRMGNGSGFLLCPFRTFASSAVYKPTSSNSISYSQCVKWSSTSNRNADWTPVVQEFTGTRMVLVPVGSFNMGSEQPENDREMPVHRQDINAPYWLDETEVTREAYENVSVKINAQQRQRTFIQPLEISPLTE